jgi:hypothetical protein
MAYLFVRLESDETKSLAVESLLSMFRVSTQITHEVVAEGVIDCEDDDPVVRESVEDLVQIYKAFGSLSALGWGTRSPR